MKLVLSEAEVRLAVAEFVQKRKEISVTPNDVEILTVATGQYEDQTIDFDGAEVRLRE